MTQQEKSADTYGNTIVAQSDLNAARDAIESGVEQAIEGATDPLTRRLFQSTRESLIHNLGRLVQPVGDNEFHDMVLPYHEDSSDFHVCETLDMQEEEVSEEDLQDDDEEEEEIDGETLLDTKAQEQARQLREKVRSISNRIQAVRSRVLDRSQKLATTDLEPDARTQLEEQNNTANESKVLELKTSLDSLSSLLASSEWSQMPQNLQSLNETIAVVRNGMDIDRPMSQTEIAIVSRSNSTEDDKNQADIHRLSQDDVADEISASDRLARYFLLLA